MNWTFIHKLGSPRWFFNISGKWVPWLLISSLLSLMVSLAWGLAFTPPDYLQGNSYRIIFVHVPASFLAQAIYMMMATAGAIALIWKIKMADVGLAVMAPIGASFCILSLVTGAVWGKPTWGTWWVWDARLTSMLILLFLYIGIIALRSSIRSTSTAARATAILSLVGVVNIPIIKFSVNWWNTLHQGATLKLTEKPSMAPEMLWPLLLSILGFYLFFTFVMVLRMRNEILHREHKTRWVRELVG